MHQHIGAAAPVAAAAVAAAATAAAAAAAAASNRKTHWNSRKFDAYGMSSLVRGVLRLLVLAYGNTDRELGFRV